MAISARYNSSPECCTWWLNSPRTPMWSIPKPLDESPDASATKYEPECKCEFYDCSGNASNLLMPPIKHACFKLANGQEDRAPINRIWESARQYPHPNKRQPDGESD